MSVRVRIAPSPTGFLHVGTARTALYNYLFAKKMGGKFILRIEDTDLQRSDPRYTEQIIESLKWLGLHWDEIYYQSQRFDIYRKYAEKLLKEGKAYYCYCTEEELERKRKEALAKKKPWKYDRRCYYLTPEEKEKFEREGRKKALRFFIPQGKVEFEDLLHGKLERDSFDIEDFVIMKSDGTPSYNFACVIDDHLMGITHVIRGEDHITNTFKQVLLYKALGWEPPKFVHLPLILGEDRSKLSKRHGAVNVLEYREMGYLPEALINFLALLGWSPGEDKEILSIDEMIERFSLEKLSKTGSVFDIKKLTWMNHEYIKRKSAEELLPLVKPFIKEEVDDAYLLKVIEIMKDRVKTLKDFWDFGNYFFREPENFDPEGVEKYLKNEKIPEYFEKLCERFEKLPHFNVEEIEIAIRELAQELGIKAKELIHPVRVAVSGRTVGPSLFHMLEVLGKERVLRRLKKWCRKN